MAGVVEVEHRAHASGGGCAGRDQDGAVVAARASAEDVARGASERADRVGGQRAVAVAGGAGVAAGAHRGCGVRGCRRSASAERMRTLCWRRRRRERWTATARRTARRSRKKRQRGFRYRCWCRVETRRRCVRRLIAMPTGCRRMREVDWSAVVSTAALHRTQFAARASVSARDAAEAMAALRALGEGRSHAAVSVGEARRAAVSWRFCLPGRERQRAGHGSGAAGNRVRCFRDAFEEVCGHFDELLDMPLGACCSRRRARGGGQAGRDGLSQPALFAVEVALFRQLEKSGRASRHAVLGHSIGELAAAAGRLACGHWRRRCRVVAARGRLMQAVRGSGGSDDGA